MQKEIEEMHNSEDSSLWRTTPGQSSHKRTQIAKEDFFFTRQPALATNGAALFIDPDSPLSPLSAGLQIAFWPPKYKPVSLPKFNGYGNSRQFLKSYEAAVASAGGDDVALEKSFIISCEGPVLNW